MFCKIVCMHIQAFTLKTCAEWRRRLRIPKMMLPVFINEDLIPEHSVLCSS